MRYLEYWALMILAELVMGANAISIFVYRYVACGDWSVMMNACQRTAERSSTEEFRAHGRSAFFACLRWAEIDGDIK